MNIFFDKAVAEDVAKRDELMDLINRIDEDPGVIDTLPFETLVQVNAYYDEKRRQLEKQIKMLKGI